MHRRVFNILVPGVTRSTLVLGLAMFVLVGCQDSKKVSQSGARAHVAELVETIRADLAEIRTGLPLGAKHLEGLFSEERSREQLAEPAKQALDVARGKVQDLRVAKSTFFAVAGRDGIVIRNDREQDRMAGKNLFAVFPALKAVLSGKPVEARGQMEEAAGVRGKPDGQWVRAEPISVATEVRGLYVTGWSWSAYAYRLEFALRGKLKSALSEYDKMPLVYVFIVVDDQIYGAPVSPLVTQEALAKLGLSGKAQGETIYTMPLELTGRDYGVAVKAVPELGPGVAVAVLRSET